MPPEETAAPQAAESTLSLDDAVSLLADDFATEEQPKEQPKAPAKEAPAADDDETVALDAVDEEAPETKETAPAASDIPDDADIILGEGKTAKLADLKQAYASLEESSTANARALQEVSAERSNLRTLGSNMAQALENISNYLVQRLPPEPDPQLAYTDPGEHYRQTMLRNNAISELRDMMSVAEGSKEAVQMLSDADFKALKAKEDQQWIASMPALKDPKRFAAADAKSKAHAKALGFSEDEVNTTADHRLRKVFFQSARYEEIQAATKTAKGKVENASIMPPPKARNQHPNSQAALEQVNAKKALMKSGKLDDALKLNW